MRKTKNKVGGSLWLGPPPRAPQTKTQETQDKTQNTKKQTRRKTLAGPSAQSPSDWGASAQRPSKNNKPMRKQKTKKNKNDKIGGNLWPGAPPRALLTGPSAQSPSKNNNPMRKTKNQSFTRLLAAPLCVEVSSNFFVFCVSHLCIACF